MTKECLKLLRPVFQCAFHSVNLRPVDKIVEVLHDDIVDVVLAGIDKIHLNVVIPDVCLEI